MQKIITSESVAIGHPDKTCDVIADAILDETLKLDPNAQNAVECAIKDDLLLIFGEATTTAQIDYTQIAAATLAEIGYTNPFRMLVQVSKQSPEINTATVGKGEVAANDQGVVYGYACNETPQFMPLPIEIAHKMMKLYDDFRKTAPEFLPDAKCQVSISYNEYDESEEPDSVHTVLLSVSHTDAVTHEKIEETIRTRVIDPVLTDYPKLDRKETKYIINPSGKFTIWGSYADSGCVGRKICVDTYGGVGRVGGGCFSSKNATKVDRSGAYYARYVAKNVVAHKMADKCEISVSYGIGLTEPLNIAIDTFGTARKSHHAIDKYVRENFNFSPANIIKELGLNQPIYKQTACYGHFGRDEFPWEQIKKQ